jgi:hypothetical protein
MLVVPLVVVHLLYPYKFSNAFVHLTKVSWLKFQWLHAITFVCASHNVIGEYFIGNANSATMAYIFAAAAFYASARKVIDAKAAVLLFKFLQCARWTKSGASLARVAKVSVNYHVTP